MGMRRSFFLAALCLVFLLLAGPALAEDETAKFSLLQTFQQGEDLLVFSEALDAGGLPVSGLGPENLRVTLGPDPVKVRSFLPFSESGEGMAYLFLVDISKSLGRKEFAAIRDSLSQWVSQMGDRDRISVMAFGEDIKILAEFENSRAEVLEAISHLAPTDNLTQLNRAILRSLEIGRRVDETLPPRRAVILVSDGMDDTRGGATREEVLRALQDKGIPLWAVGFSSGKLTASKKAGLSSLGEMARISGGDVFLVEGRGGFAGAFSSLRNRIMGAYVARLDCAGVPGTGETLRLQAVLSQAGRAFTDGRDVRFLRALVEETVSSSADPVSGEGESVSENPTSDMPDKKNANESSQEESPGPDENGFPLAGAAAVILLLGGGFLFMKGRSRKQEIEDEMEEPFASDTIGERAGVSMALGLPLRLIVVRGPQKGESFDLSVDDPISLGRAQKGNQLVLQGDLGISGRHLEIFRQEGALFVRDLRSTNGTFVNGVKIQEARRIYQDDLLLLGGTELRVILSR